MCIRDSYWPLTLGDDAEWNIHRAGIHVIPENEQEIIRQRSKPGFLSLIHISRQKQRQPLYSCRFGNQICNIYWFRRSLARLEISFTATSPV